MAGVRGRGPAGAAEFMGRCRPPVGPRSLGAPNRHRQGCALYRDPSEVERRAPRATTHGPRTRVGRLAYGTDAVTRTGRSDVSGRVEERRSDGLLGERGNERRCAYSAPPVLHATALLL